MDFVYFWCVFVFGRGQGNANGVMPENIKLVDNEHFYFPFR